jgi:hypothetical protein
MRATCSGHFILHDLITTIVDERKVCETVLHTHAFHLSENVNCQYSNPVLLDRRKVFPSPDHGLIVSKRHFFTSDDGQMQMNILVICTLHVFNRHVLYFSFRMGVKLGLSH